MELTRRARAEPPAFLPRAPGRSVRRLLVGALAAAALASSALPARVLALPPDDPSTGVVATFSIAAYDPQTGDLGVAVASRVLAVGAVVPWAQAGIGAVATQALTNPTFGPRGLSLLSQGKSAQEALGLLVASDPDRGRRQIGLVDGQGRVATYTGDGCQSWAGGRTGKHYTAQGNILAGAGVVEAIGDAFEGTEGSLADRLVAALAAGEQAGGDSRGKQSAAILVVRARGGANNLNDRYCDLRVDDAEEPVVELTRLYGIWRRQRLLRDAFDAYNRKDWDDAIDLTEKALALDPQDAGTRYNLACFYARDGKSRQALDHLAVAVHADAAYRNLALADSDLVSLRDEEAWKSLFEGGETPR